MSMFLSNCEFKTSINLSYIPAKRNYPFKLQTLALSGWLSWSTVPYTKTLRVSFPVRAGTYVAGLIPDWGTYGRQPINVSHIDVSLSSFLFL